MEKNKTFGAPSCYTNRNQQAQMIQEIQKLASALIAAEQRIAQLKKGAKHSAKKLKGIVTDQEECMALLQEKVVKMQGKIDRMESE